MPEPDVSMWRSPDGRYHCRRIAAAAVILALGSGAVADTWLRVLSAYGYELPATISVAFARLEVGSWRAIALVALIGPFIEELLFRSGLQRVLLWFYGPAVAVLSCAVVFAAVHMNWAQFGPALWMGIVTGTIFARTGSLALCFLWHATYNAQFVFRWSGLRIGGPPPVGFEYTGSQAGAILVRLALLVLGLGVLWRALNALPDQYRPAWARPVKSVVVDAGPADPSRGEGGGGQSAPASA